MKTFEFEITFQFSNLQYIIVGSDIGLAPNRRQAIIRISDGQVYWRIYTSLSELNILITFHRVLPVYFNDPFASRD